MRAAAILMATWLLTGTGVSAQSAQQVQADGAVSSKDGSVDAAEMDRCVASFIETYLAIGKGEQIPKKNDLFRRIILDQEGRGLTDIPVEFLARDTCAPGTRYGLVPYRTVTKPTPPVAPSGSLREVTDPEILKLFDEPQQPPEATTGFPPSPPNPHDPRQMVQWREACLGMVLATACYQEEQRLYMLPQTHNLDGFPLPPIGIRTEQAMDAWNEECLKVKSGSECWRERGRLSKLPR
jgi:hypothetical protein